MGIVVINRNFSLNSLHGFPHEKTALLINPPVYDTQYWSEWSQPAGLLRIGAWLKKCGYKRVELFDFLETDAERKVPRHRINPEEKYDLPGKEPNSPIKPIVISKDGEELRLYKYHFGKTWREFEIWMDGQGFTAQNPPDEIWISAIMTYWWEAVRDLIARLKYRFDRKTTVILGGVYPTLVPEHAATMTQADIIVVGEVAEASDMWTDLSLYPKPPNYAIITPNRGCIYNCSYCAQRTLNGGHRQVRQRPPEDVVKEMYFKYESYGIREFAFYADALLHDYENGFQRILEILIERKAPFRLHAPEGLDVRALSQSQRLLELMKAAHMEKIYLPLESIAQTQLTRLGRRHVTLEHFVKAAKMAERAGFRLRNLEVNAFVLYGLPEEKIEEVVQTIIFVSEVVGSIIPMLFAPVPGTKIYNTYLSYITERGWDKNLHMLNGKLYPFLELNEGTLSDYIDLQRLMFTLNTHYRSKSFQLFGPTKVSKTFRELLNSDVGELIKEYKEVDV
ncbi:Radical SAM superfamily protein [Neomoorella glycerini]|uniref:Radical SAM superfamily protein n=1 Tax=Neomoorella glycerini TaxID=55779 RepID=A0A6I5ZRG1_9FIRM|nr:radical SAM protein [Moorella glycerini]QGP92269.1 Radical SAM superfamily protein [Moorella glycerini]